MRSNQEILNNLKKLDDIFSVDIHWIKGASATTKQIPGENKTTVCYCLTGALGEIVAGDPYRVNDIYPELKAMGFTGVGTAQLWNDNIDRTITEIRTRVKDAIKKLSTGEPPVHTPVSLTISAPAAQAITVQTTATPKAPKASGPGIRRYPKGHELGGKFVPAEVTDAQYKALCDEAAKPKAPETKAAYKGFNNSSAIGALHCRGTVFKVGEKLQVRGAVQRCRNGFHACENPFDVFQHYSLNQNHAFGKVTLHGPFDKDAEKIAAKGIVVDEILSWPHLMNTLVKFARENPDNPYVKRYVKINNGQSTECQPIWDFQVGDGASTNQNSTASTLMSNKACAEQRGNGQQFAFGRDSQQFGSSWQVSHGDNIATVNYGAYGCVEVLGKNSIATLLGLHARVRGIEGTKIAFANAHGQTAYCGVIGKGGLEPMKWIGLKNLYVPAIPAIPATAARYEFKLQNL